MKALLCRSCGIRQIAADYSHLVGTSNFSSLSHALRRVSGVNFLLALVRQLQASTSYYSGELVALDSMAVTMGKTRRHGCAKFNNNAVGGGVLWSYRIKAPAGTCPVALVKLMRGAWNDAGLMQGVELQSNGPVYLMDRGFYCIDLIGRWLGSKVRFIVRVKARYLVYDVLKPISQPRTLRGGWQLQLDAMVELGSRNRKNRPRVRLIIACSPKGEQFVYATSETQCGAGHIIECYKQRWHIERFHRFMKDSLGLAHLYSFDAAGLEFLILTALLTAMLLFTSSAYGKEAKTTICLLYTALTQARKQLHINPPWRRNILAVRRSKPKRKTRGGK